MTRLQRQRKEVLLRKQSDVADEMGLSRFYLSQLESGQHPIPYYRIPLFAQVYQMSIQEVQECMQEMQNAASSRSASSASS